MFFLDINSRVESFAQLVTLVLIFGFVLAITYFGTRWVSNFQKEKMSGCNIKVLDTLRITNTKYIQVVKIGEKCFAISVCKDTVTYLCEVNEDDLVLNDESQSGLKSENFKEILDKFKKDKPKD